MEKEQVWTKGSEDSTVDSNILDVQRRAEECKEQTMEAEAAWGVLGAWQTAGCRLILMSAFRSQRVVKCLTGGRRDERTRWISHMLAKKDLIHPCL